MKKLFLICLLITSCTTFAQNNSKRKKCNCDRLTEVENTWFLKDEAFNGTCTAKYPNGKLLCKIQFKNGLIVGKLKKYYNNGKLREATVYKNGVPNGSVKYYFDNGKPSQIGQVANDIKIGTWKTFHLNGKVKAVEYFKNGLLEGKVVNYAPNGKIQLKGRFKNGKEEGKWIFYNTYNENIQKVLYYRNGDIVETQQMAPQFTTL